jgi:CspA family cold shock protein
MRAGATRRNRGSTWTVVDTWAQFAVHASGHEVIPDCGGSGLAAHFSAKKTQMAQGTIKRLTDKGFGFIDTGSGKDIFFHQSSLEGVRYEDLREGQQVSFDESEGPKGPRAENVRPV